MNDAAEVIRAAATDDTNIIFGATIDDRLNGQVWVTVVATGLRRPRPPAARRPRDAADRAAPPTGRGHGDLDVPSFLKS